MARYPEAAKWAPGLGSVPDRNLRNGDLLVWLRDSGRREQQEQSPIDEQGELARSDDDLVQQFREGQPRQAFLRLVHEVDLEHRLWRPSDNLNDGRRQSVGVHLR